MLEDKIKDLENRLGRQVRDLEKRLDEAGRRLERKIDAAVGSGTQPEDEEASKPSGGGLFWGIVLLIAGVIWLGNNLDWFYVDVPWVAVMLIAGGITLIARFFFLADREKKE